MTPKKNLGITEAIFLYGMSVFFSLFAYNIVTGSLYWFTPLLLVLAIVLYRFSEADRKERIAYKAYKKANGST
jgi:hypothetical protein